MAVRFDENHVRPMGRAAYGVNGINLEERDYVEMCIRDSERDWPTSKRSWTAVETLLTFWPPGPEARTKVIVSSESGMNMGKCYFQNSP